MVKHKRKNNKALKRVRHKTLDDIVNNNYPGKKQTGEDMMNLHKYGYRVCGYLRDVYKSSDSFYGYCAKSKRDCCYKHLTSYAQCDIYNEKR